MSAIRGKDTAPEMAIRKALHRKGFRYRLHVRELPGRPDLVLPQHEAVVFIHGCFWHQHDCAAFKMPESRREFWQEKIGRNVARDVIAMKALTDAGWRIATVWECSIRGPRRLGIDTVVTRLENWLLSKSPAIELRDLG